MLTRDRAHFLLLNLGHLFDHLMMLVFATVAALALGREWGMSYGELVPYATPGFLAFGLCALPWGWLADRWSREGMMVVFFLGTGLAAISAGLAPGPLTLAAGLLAIGVFAAIYHPVGLALVTLRWRNTGMRIAVNGVYGNLGVAGAALITGWLIDTAGWRMAFILPGLVSIALGIAYLALRREAIRGEHRAARKPARDAAPARPDPARRAALMRIAAIVFVTAALGSLVYQSTTFALPKVFDERIGGLAARLAAGLPEASGAGIATVIGSLAFLVFALGSLAQLVVGALLDRAGPRTVFATVALLQLVFFTAMPALTDGAAVLAATGFMLGAFGQIPINDYMIGRLASGPWRARVFAARYVVSFTSLALALPLIALIYDRWGFDTLFRALALAAAVILAAALMLPRRLPAPAAA